MSKAIRRSCQTQTAQKLIQNFPNVQKAFDHVTVNRPGDQDYPLRATLPIYTKEAKQLTYAAYDLYVMAYNKNAIAQNRDLKKQMLAGKLWFQKQLPEKKDNITMVQLGFAANNKLLFTKEYNQKAVAYNLKYGAPIIPLRKIQTIKPPTKEVFKLFLWAYGDQLMKMKRMRETSGMSWERTVFKMEVNTKHLENSKGDFGMYMNQYCPDTLLNHKNRLIEAGILINSEYRSSKRGTLHHICPEILVVFDDFDQKLIYTDNQLLKIGRPEVFRDIVTPTSSISKPKVKREVDNSPSLDKDKSEKDLHHSFLAEKATRAPSGKMANPELTHRAQKNSPAAKNSKIGVSAGIDITEGIHGIARTDTLAKELSNNLGVHTTPVPIETLKKEANTGTMSQTDFRILLIQLFFRKIAPIYQEHPDFDMIFWPLWQKMLNVWEESHAFKNKNGAFLHKNTMLVQYRELVYCVENSKWGALAFVKKGTFSPPNPSIYLNPYNTTPGTFLFHFKQVATSNPKKFKAIREVNQDLKNQGSKANTYKKYINRLNSYFAKFYNKKMDEETLLRYVKNNMPVAVQQNFDKHHDNFRNNKLIKNGH